MAENSKIFTSTGDSKHKNDDNAVKAFGDSSKLQNGAGDDKPASNLLQPGNPTKQHQKQQGSRTEIIPNANSLIHRFKTSTWRKMVTVFPSGRKAKVEKGGEEVDVDEMDSSQRRSQ
jgi:hypothetical protein